MIVFKDVTKTFLTKKKAIDDVNFTVENGEFIFLVGPSGAGKTTILRLIFRELLPTSGSIFVGNIEVNKIKKRQIPALRRKIGYIFQDFKILHDRTVAENVAIALEILGLKKEEIESRVAEVLATIGLKEKDDYFPSQLSLGELQRVAIGRAVVGNTDIILADEPTGNLDPKTAWDILKLLVKINREGKTIIMATHNLDIVESLKKPILFLENGKITKSKGKLY
ncbi:cell division ATP-binding protein FtsE [Candidatus Gottesmanbacteria bacterium]|nr:cell division ATP-binding protein FtsE [Candidatus Gottesmanbacteria bacterium]